MGMFGRTKYSHDPSVEGRLSLGDRAKIFGLGVLSPQAADQYIYNKTVAPGRTAFMTDLASRLGPQFQDAPPIDVTTGQIPETNLPTKTSDGLDINSPDLPGLAFKAMRYGVPIDKVLDVLKAQQPDVRFDRGYGYNGKTGAAMGGFHTELDKGMRPGADGTVGNAPGYVGAAAEAAGAVAGAQEGAKAGWDLVDVQINGKPVKLPRAVAAPLLMQAFGRDNPGALPAGFGQGLSPIEESAGKIKGDAAANAQVTLPADLNGVDTAIETAGNLLKHPALDKRTGAWSMLPAIPGTPGASFEAYKKQVLGQGWLDARQALKGGGSITDYEGKKAEQAKIRMEAAQTPDDFKTALTDYIGALQRGRVILQQKAGASPAPVSGHTTGPRTTGFRSRIISTGP